MVVLQTDSVGSFQYLAPPAVIMTLAARGFVLWFANLALLAFLVHSLPAVHQHKKVSYCFAFLWRFCPGAST